MYCSITTVPVAFYWACSDDTVHYKSDPTHWVRAAARQRFRLNAARRRTGPVIWNGTDLHQHSSGDRCRLCCDRNTTGPYSRPSRGVRGIHCSSSREDLWWYSSCSATRCCRHSTHVTVVLPAVHESWHTSHYYVIQVKSCSLYPMLTFLLLFCLCHAWQQLPVHHSN